MFEKFSNTLVYMDQKLNKVKHTFDKIKNMREEISGLFQNLDTRISKLKEIYNDFIKNNNSKLFVFGLDTFYFQNNSLTNEYTFLKDSYNRIINRMYCEYYKLYKVIVEFIEARKFEYKVHELTQRSKQFPVYKDLEQNREYDFTLIVDINEEIIIIINSLTNVLKDKETSLDLHIERNTYGLNIDNFVSTFRYEVVVLKEQILLFENYLDFFYNLHKKYLSRFITKIGVFQAQTNHDIIFDGGLVNKRVDNNVILNELDNGFLDPKMSRQLRKSISIKTPIQASGSISSLDSDNESINNVDEIPGRGFNEENESVKSTPCIQLTKKGIDKHNHSTKHINKIERIIEMYDTRQGCSHSNDIIETNDLSKSNVMSMFDEIVESDTDSSDSFVRELTKREKKSARKNIN